MRCAVLQRSLCSYSWRLRHPCILLIYLSVSFVIISRVSTIKIVVFKVPHIFCYIFLVFVFNYSFVFSDCNSLAMRNHLEGMNFPLLFLIPFHHLLSSIFLSVWIAKSQRGVASLNCVIGSDWCLSYLPNPSARAGYDKRSVFKRSLTGLNSEFSFSYTSCHTKAEEPSLPYYLRITGGRIIGFIPFPRVLVLCEMQSVSSRI